MLTTVDGENPVYLMLGVRYVLKPF
jgi:hypothetical protein